MSLDLTIVSGTFDRLSYLQKMVESAHASLSGPYGLTWEFSLVDGGSRDGTQDWCKAQPDVRLIEHGRLLGAVRAFNDGARAALGNYVILANDDIEFIEDSILRAWVFMQAHPDIGIGCFYQDRHGQAWHVENMPAVKDGVQVSVPYGQVCIVPRWLGDAVGWWGDYLHTYGGDNELTSNVYEMGYKVVPIPNAKIHDAMPNDYLRSVNNITGRSDPRAVRGSHPDTMAWGKRWSRRPEHMAYPNGYRFTGPIVRDSPVQPNLVPVRERILYLPIYEQGWDVQKTQKRGLREALTERGVVVEVDYVSVAQQGKDALVDRLRTEIERLQPTLILTQLHNAETLTVNAIRTLRRMTTAPWVNWNGDFWPQNLLSEDGLALAKTVDLQLTVNRSVLEQYQARGIKAAYWQIGWEPDGVGQPPGEAHDVVFLASGYSQARQSLVKQIRSWGLDFALHGSGWPEGWSMGQCLYDFKTGCSIYRGAKISLGDSQWPDSGFVSNRVMQALAAGGAALAHQWFRGMEELGLEDGKTCIVWREVGELRSRIAYYLTHEAERQAIAQAGEQLALTRHSFQARVRELFAMLPERKAEQVEGDWRW